MLPTVDNHSALLVHQGPATDDSFASFRRLAASLIALSISDLKSKDRRIRKDAQRFLFATNQAARAVRQFWLAWLDHDEQSFYKLLRQNTYQGLPNKLGNVQVLIDNATSSYFNSLPPLPAEDTEHLFEKAKPADQAMAAAA
jgi:hypothetical protein